VTRFRRLLSSEYYSRKWMSDQNNGTITTLTDWSSVHGWCVWVALHTSAPIIFKLFPQDEYDCFLHEKICAVHSVTAHHHCSYTIFSHLWYNAEWNQLQIVLHGVFSFTSKDYREKTSLSNIASHFGAADNDWTDDTVVPAVPCIPSAPDRANATFVILARNSDLDGTMQSIRDMEDKFNRRHGYPYVFLNEVPFNDEFKKSTVFSSSHMPRLTCFLLRRRISNIISSHVEFGVIPHDHWFQPAWINETRAAAGRQRLKDEHVIYGGVRISFSSQCHRLIIFVCFNR
jgi:Glycolipid 2-alpha-mannosyltransferase